MLAVEEAEQQEANYENCQTSRLCRRKSQVTLTIGTRLLALANAQPIDVANTSSSLCIMRVSPSGYKMALPGAS